MVDGFISHLVTSSGYDNSVSILRLFTFQLVIVVDRQYEIISLKQSTFCTLYLKNVYAQLGLSGLTNYVNLINSQL